VVAIESDRTVSCMRSSNVSASREVAKRIPTICRALVEWSPLSASTADAASKGRRRRCQSSTVASLLIT
jgi:hypothetical protein